MFEVLMLLAQLTCASETKCVEALFDCYTDDNVVWCTENKKEVVETYWDLYE